MKSDARDVKGVQYNKGSILHYTWETFQVVIEMLFSYDRDICA